MQNRKIIRMILVLLLTFLLATAQAETAFTSPSRVPVYEYQDREIRMFDIPWNEALTFTREIDAGWNLGNTFDAYDDRGNSKGLSLETYWCHARTTPALIDALLEAGFNMIRIPVSWHNHVDAEYNIDSDWLERVAEVAEYALSKGMYVIINIHHDNNQNFIYPLRSDMNRSSAFLSAVWRQVAVRFIQCSDHLIFESMNEPRLVGDPMEWSWDENNPRSVEAMECINELNQLFVDTVRETGGENARRYLMVPGYAANAYSVCSDIFVIPRDTIDNHILIAVHAYTPYRFALEDSQNSHFGGQNDKSEIGNFMNGLYEKYIASGIPVIIDEFGARNKNENLQDRVDFAAYYTASASARGIPCCWWDNHVFSGRSESFGIIDRKSSGWVYPEIAQAIIVNCRYNRK